jgi:ring-1,2-phenylacetyl-CoA epoxidase subunit PaaC
MVELPKGDWAFTLLRQFLFDSAEKVRLAWLSHSAYAPVAAAAAKMYKEEIYHYRHTSAWVRRLGLGTDESRRRMGKALDELWPYTRQLFEPVQDEALLFSAGLAPDSADLLAEWDASVGVFLHDCSLTVPDVPRRELTRREHTVHLEQLLAEMQSVARLEPDAAW